MHKLDPNGWTTAVAPLAEEARYDVVFCVVVKLAEEFRNNVVFCVVAYELWIDEKQALPRQNLPMSRLTPVLEMKSWNAWELNHLMLGVLDHSQKHVIEKFELLMF